jgi:exo-beta-1,3-glucanase (GH17 family)
LSQGTVEFALGVLEPGLDSGSADAEVEDDCALAHPSDFVEFEGFAFFGGQSVAVAVEEFAVVHAYSLGRPAVLISAASSSVHS